MCEVVLFRSVPSCMPRIQPGSFFLCAQTLMTNGDGHIDQQPKVDQIGEFGPSRIGSIGICMSEQYSLNRSQIDFERRQMYLPRSTNGDSRDVPLNGTAISALPRLRKESDQSLVFPNAEIPRGRFLAAVELVGLRNYTRHCNRHTFASRLVMAGVDLHMAGELLGHRTAQMANRYAHLSVNHKQAAVERISMVQSATKTAASGNKAQRAPRKLL